MADSSDPLLNSAVALVASRCRGLHRERLCSALVQVGAGQDLRQYLASFPELEPLRRDLSGPALTAAQADIASWSRAGIALVGFGMANYPSLLKQIYDPPLTLFYRGACPGKSGAVSVAIVGSRRADQVGTAVAQSFSSGLASHGVGVVSGLAYGIDSVAHAGALQGGGITVAVLGCGVDRIYPAANRQLAFKILDKGGTLMSQFEPGVAPYPANFLNRNRVIAGLVMVVIVIQAGERSGSLVTARYANEEGRDCLVVPGNVLDPNWTGSNRLIKQGAQLVSCFEDIREQLGLAAAASKADTLDSPAKQLLDLFTKQNPIHLDELTFRYRGERALPTVVLELELKGYLTRVPGNHLLYRGVI